MTTATNNVARVAAAVAGLALVATSFVPFAGAQTTTTTTTTTASATFTRNLTIGSTGADVTALQTWLINKGFTIAAGATGYFGAQTKAALGSYQASVGISPAVGYFGPITRAQVAANGSSTTTTTTGLPAGCTSTAGFSPTTGASCATSTSLPAGCLSTAGFSPTTGVSCSSGTTTTTTTNGSITTVGAEGTINIEKETSGIKTNLYEGDSKAAVLGVRVEAKSSDVLVSRVRVNLGTTTDSYTKLYSRIYLTDGSGNVLASQDLNSSTVTRVSGTIPTYYVTLSGFDYLVKKDQKLPLYVKVDLYPSISTQYQGSKTFSFYETDAIRATDGAGIDQYSSGAQNITQSVTVSSNLSDTATLTVSTDPSVRKAATIVANKGANNNEVDMEEVGSFRLLAEKDNVLMRDLSVTVANTATSSANLQTLYLYDGSTSIASASADSNGIYLFTSINQTLTKDAYKTYLLKADFRSVTSGATIKVGNVSVTSAESTGTGRTISSTSLATGAGEVMTLVAKGVVLTLDTKTIDITTSKSTAGSTTEAHLSSVFNVNLTAIGADATFGNATTSFNFVLLKNGVVLGNTSATRSTFYPATQPTGTTNFSAFGFTLPRNATVSIPVTFKVDATGETVVASDLPSADYSVRLNSVVYTSGGSTVTNDYTTNVNYVTVSKTRP